MANNNETKNSSGIMSILPSTSQSKNSQNGQLNGTGWKLVLTILITILTMLKNGIGDSEEAA